MKYLKILFFTAVALVAFVGCQRNPVIPEFGMVQVDTLFVNGNRQLAVQYEFTSIVNIRKSPVLQDIERANINRFFQLEEFEGSAQEALDESLRAVLAELAADSLAARIASEEQICSTSTAEVVDSVLVYTISSYSYTGGAHGNMGITALSYSLKDGRELMLSDFFNERQRQQLLVCIHEKLYAEYGVTDDKGLEAAGFFPEQIGMTDNFALTAEGITFFYNPYEIGCYALGGIEVSFSREELAEL